MEETIVIALWIALASADVPPPSGSTRIHTEYRIENFEDHPELSFYVGPLSSGGSGDLYSPFYKGSVLFGRLDRGTKQVHTMPTATYNTLREEAMASVRPRLEREKKQLAELDATSSDPATRKRIQRQERIIRSLERSALGEEYRQAFVKNLIPCSLSTSTRYTSYEGDGLWVNTLRIVGSSPGKCPLKWVSAGFVPAQPAPASDPEEATEAKEPPSAPPTEEQGSAPDKEPTRRVPTDPSGGGCTGMGGGCSGSMMGWVLLGSVFLRTRRFLGWRR